MDKTTSIIRSYFEKLGLEHEIADIYLALYAFGPQTISELSRNSKVERTRIYRLIDELMASNLIELEQDSHRGIVKAAPIANIRILITQKEQELSTLRDELETVEQLLSKNTLASPATKVQLYKGPEGIRQMMWNQTRAKTDLLSIMHEPINKTVGEKFLIRWTNTINNGDMKLKIVFDEHFNKLNNEWYKKTGHSELVKNLENKILPEETYKITVNIDIWDDVVCYYNWKDGEVFGIEIYNKDIADAQRQLFEMLWQK